MLHPGWVGLGDLLEGSVCMHACIGDLVGCPPDLGLLHSQALRTPGAPPVDIARRAWHMARGARHVDILGTACTRDTLACIAHM